VLSVTKVSFAMPEIVDIACTVRMEWLNIHPIELQSLKQKDFLSQRYQAVKGFEVDVLSSETRFAISDFGSKNGRAIGQ
jgi:hypothetical protein